jgi:PAS domain S-box-containing protein
MIDAMGVRKGQALHGVWRRLGPPADLKARIRWLFVIGSLSNATFILLGLAFLSDAGWLQRGLAVAGVAWLAYHLLQGYRQLRFSRFAPLIEGVVVALAVASLGDVHRGLEFFYIGLFFRILYRSVWELVGLVASYAGAYMVAAIVWPTLTGVTPSSLPAELISNLAGFAIVGILKWGLTVSSSSNASLAAREHNLARAATAIMGAREPHAIYVATLDAAQALLRRTTVQRVSLEVADEPVTRMTIGLDNPSVGSAKSSEPAPELIVSIVPVHLRDGGEVARLILESERPLSTEISDALSRLAAEVSLSLESVLLIASLKQQVVERQQAQELLLLRDRALAAATSAVVVVDARAPGRPILHVNPASERLLGYSAEELLGSNLRLLLSGPDTSREVTAQLMQIAIEGREETHEFIAYRKDGTPFNLEAASARVRATDGTVTHCVWVFSDVTSRKEAEQQAHALAHAEKLRALGQMASGIAHDLNQSLMLIASHSSVGLRTLQQEPLDLEEVRETLTVVAQAAMDGGQTVKRLLLFASTPTVDAMRPLDLTALARDVMQLTSPHWRDAAQADGRPIDFQLDSVGHPIVLGPHERLREMLVNLVLNAVDALPSGGTIKMRVFADEDRARIEVSDNGLGMSAAVQARIFEPFFTTKGDKGTGLGLATVFGLVEHLKGEIRVQSAPGTGTAFHIAFPRSAIELQTLAASSGALAKPSTQRRQLRILAVDDEPAITRALSRLLRPMGHVVTTAESAEQALERLDVDAFDVIVSDLGMGAGMNGWELADQVRQRWPTTTFVLATGWGASIDAAEARVRGVDAVLAKPYLPSDLEPILAAA